MTLSDYFQRSGREISRSTLRTGGNRMLNRNELLNSEIEASIVSDRVTKDLLARKEDLDWITALQSKEQLSPPKRERARIPMTPEKREALADRMRRSWDTRRSLRRTA
jgi:hypothetical protein